MTLRKNNAAKSASKIRYLTGIQMAFKHHLMTSWALQIAEACGVFPEAVRLVDRLRARLRSIASLVAKDNHRPRVLSLEGLAPLCSGKPSSQVELLVCTSGTYE